LRHESLKFLDSGCLVLRELLKGARCVLSGEAMNSAQRFMECRERNAVSFDFGEMDRLYYRVNDQIGLLEWDHVIALLCHD
jgi:hypothetical protein